MPRLLVADLGLRPYTESLTLQRALARARISGELDEDLLLLVEHPAVITLGRSSKDRHLLATPAMLEARGIELHEVERGGDVTFHGPGQLVGYPIIDLKRHKQDLHWYLRQVEEALIRALAPFGITGARSAGQTGVWSDGRKLASIGVHARDWVVWHGFALNVTTDLSFFDVIVPCGIAGVRMSSVEQEMALRGDAALPSSIELGRAVRAQVVRGFSDVFSLESTELDLAVLDRVAATTVPL